MTEVTEAVKLPDGFAIERAVPLSMVSYPMFATFDSQGRLFVCESSGKTTSTEDVLENPTFKILLLEDEDGNGVFDKKTVFADKIPYTMGGTFYQGSFYAAAPPDLLKLTDTNSDGVADQREIILTGWTLNHNAATLSGPFFGPDGWMYMCDARRGFAIQTKEGTQLRGKGARIWRCRPDGTGLEWISGGGFDNTIELIFMPSGETIGTMTYFMDPADGFRDALMHWVEGGVYPKPFPVIEEDKLKMTGDLMPVMTRLARVSPAGLMRYRGSAFGEEYHGNLFSAQFNTGRIVRHVVIPDGGTFRTVDEPFLQWDNLETHPTDVLEDADGSLLIVNTGGWFIAGCPLSVVAKTDVAGGIFRVSKKVVRKLEDPWGKEIDFQKTPAEQLCELLDDSRPVVRDRAAEHLVSLGEKSMDALGKILTSSAHEEVRAAAVFVLSRIQTDKAFERVLSALDDKSSVVRTAAARVLGMARRPEPVTKLSEALSDDSLSVRRQAATALGQIGHPDAISVLIAASENPGDRFVEHAITLSLITLARPHEMVQALSDPRENVRKTALIVLDQIETSPLRKSDVVPFLESRSVHLQETALWVLSHRSDWSDVVVTYLESQFRKPVLQKAEMTRLKNVMINLAANPPLQNFIASRLTDKTTPNDRKMLLLEVMSKTPDTRFPDQWSKLLGALLKGKDTAMQSSVLALLQSRSIPAMRKHLQVLIDNEQTPPVLRIKALAARLTTDKLLSQSEFQIVMEYIVEQNEPLLKQSAAGLLVLADLSDEQLLKVAQHIPSADLLVLPTLVNAFQGNSNEQVGKALIAALGSSRERLENLSVETMQQLLKAFPISVNESAQTLVETLKEAQASRLATLERIESSLTRGDVAEGRKLFFGKALCSTCHAVLGQGGTFGPDLTNIGEIRTRHDILEAIVYPSASLAREYETVRVVTGATSYSGITREELPESVVVGTGPGAMVRLARHEIISIEPEQTSLMPPGLDKQLTTAEMSDLMAYLTTLPDGLGHLKSDE